MNIPINKDVEKEYKNELTKGFTAREILYGIAAIGSDVGIAALLHYMLDLNLKYCIYIGFPALFGIAFLGFKEFQGLSCIAYLKEILYEKRTEVLSYEADEVPVSQKCFTLERQTEKQAKGSWKEKGGR